MIININFTSGDNYSYTSISSYGRNDLMYNTDSAYGKGGWYATNLQIITLDTNQTNFNTFITAMKDNIEGVLLESGTYKWVDSPSNLTELYYPNLASAVIHHLVFKSDNNEFLGINYYLSSSLSLYAPPIGEILAYTNGL